MADDVRLTLRKALAKLNFEKTRIDKQVTALQTALAGLGTRAQVRARRTMSAAARKAVGKRMKAYWAKHRAKTKKSATAAR